METSQLRFIFVKCLYMSINENGHQISLERPYKRRPEVQATLRILPQGFTFHNVLLIKVSDPILCSSKSPCRYGD